jgi:hypothetical protein
LRFFTRATLERMWPLAGLTVERRVLLKKSAFATEMDTTPTSLVDMLALAWLTRDPLSSVYQFLYVLGREGFAAVEEEVGATTTLLEIVGAYRAQRRRSR